MFVDMHNISKIIDSEKQLKNFGVRSVGNIDYTKILSIVIDEDIILRNRLMASEKSFQKRVKGLSEVFKDRVAVYEFNLPLNVIKEIIKINFNQTLVELALRSTIHNGRPYIENYSYLYELFSVCDCGLYVQLYPGLEVQHYFPLI